MKKTVFLLLLFISTIIKAQTVPKNSRLAITQNIKQNSATRIVVQDSITKELNWVLKSSLSPIQTLDNVLAAGNYAPNKAMTVQNIYANYIYPNCIQFANLKGFVLDGIGIGYFRKFGGNWESSALIKYSADLSSIFDDRTLVDRGFVNTAISGIPTTTPTLQQVTTAGATTNVPTYFSTTDPDFEGIASISVASDNGIAISASGGSAGVLAFGGYAGISAHGSMIGVASSGEIAVHASGTQVGINAYSQYGVAGVFAIPATYPDADNTIITNNSNIVNFVNENDVVSSISYDGKLTANQFILSASNTAPASANAPGTLGEIRVTASYIYYCRANYTWVRSALTTW